MRLQVRFMAVVAAGTVAFSMTFISFTSFCLACLDERGDFAFVFIMTLLRRWMWTAGQAWALTADASSAESDCMKCEKFFQEAVHSFTRCGNDF